MSDFENKIVTVVRAIPKGKVASYGQIAALIGAPRAARQVGQILRTSKQEMPWWRVVNKDGRISIKNPEITPDIQKAFLEKDGVEVTSDYSVDIATLRFSPSDSEIKKFELSTKTYEALDLTLERV